MKFDRPLPETLNELFSVQHLAPGVGEWAKRWNIREREIPQLQEGFAAGDNGCALAAVSLCLEYEIPIPAWAADGLVAARNKVAAFEVGSWDDVFGRPHPKGAHLAARRKQLAKRPAIYIDVLRAIEAGRAVDEALFEEIGKKHAVGKTLAAEFYYAEKREIDSF